MARVFDAPVWAGVAMRFADGRTYAVELDGTRSLITFEINSVVEGDWDAFGGSYFTEERRSVEVKLRGEGSPWRFHWDDVPRAPESIAAPVKAIEESS